jgi:glycosyltransferase involved in cell wall biosynthesis
MELADVVVTACTFAANTIRESFDKKVVIAPYGVDLPFPQKAPPREGPLRIIYAGAASVRKGVPLLLEVWRDLGWKDAELILVGSWQLASARAAQLPPGVQYLGMMSQKQANQEISKSDWLILPSNFEGYGLVILEALANGVPVIASTATGAGDLGPSPAIKLMEPDSRDSLVEALQQAKKSRERGLRGEARRIASVASWGRYRKKVVSVAEAFL